MSCLSLSLSFKCQEEAGGPAAGDVVVGWINTATGQVWQMKAMDNYVLTSFFQGGLDDYFLSGSQTCSDGAESCPDTTKVTRPHTLRPLIWVLPGWREERGNAELCVQGQLHHADIQVTGSRWNPRHNTAIPNPGVHWKPKISMIQPSSRHTLR